MPDHPHGEIQTHHVKAEDGSHREWEPVTGVSDAGRSQAEQTHAVPSGPAARTPRLQGEPSQPSDTEKLQPTPPAIMPPGVPYFI